MCPYRALALHFAGYETRAVQCVVSSCLMVGDVPYRGDMPWNIESVAERSAGPDGWTA